MKLRHIIILFCTILLLLNLQPNDSFAQTKKPTIKLSNKKNPRKKSRAGSTQDLRLANQFFQKGEFDKAVKLYKKLYEENPKRSHYYRSYLKTLISMNDFVAAEQLIKGRLLKEPKNVGLNIDLGYLYKNQEQPERAIEMYDKVLGGATKKDIRNLAHAFINASEYDYAIKAYLRGRELMKDEKAFAYNLAKAYSKRGDFEEMIGAYLDYANNDRSIQMIKNSLQKLVKAEDMMEEMVYTKLLVWALEQQEDYEAALVQVKALDKRLKENGDRIMNLMKRAFSEKQYDVAIDGYNYVIEKGEKNSLYIPAKLALLKAQKNQLIETNEYNTEQLKSLEANYLEVLNMLGRKPATAHTMRDLCEVYAYYLHDLPKAIATLEEILKMGSVKNRLKAEVKLDLGDYYLMKGDIWESTLLYSQVDKTHKEDMLGEEARFKNAQLSYFNGDFGWSQAQLDVLKASTSELIANDALNLSVFITDNLGLDTTKVPMQMFAHADLLILQNKYSQATNTLDSIKRMFPKHPLDDDVLMSRAKIKLKDRNYEAALPILQKIYSEYNEDLLADDALFISAEIYENQLNDKEKAMEFYQTLLIEHPASLLMVEARKRYRKLRGDILN